MHFTYTGCVCLPAFTITDVGRVDSFYACTGISAQACMQCTNTCIISACMCLCGYVCLIAPRSQCTDELYCSPLISSNSLSTDFLSFSPFLFCIHFFSLSLSYIHIHTHLFPFSFHSLNPPTPTTYIHTHMHTVLLPVSNQNTNDAVCR